MRPLPVITSLICVALGLALVGQYRVAPGAFAADPLQSIYQALQLFFWNGDWTRDLAGSSVEVQVARFLAPAVTIASFVLVFAHGAWVAVVNWMARFARDHVVLVGLNALGWHFARSCRQLGLRTVAIERNEQNPYVDQCRRIGIAVLVGDALTGNALERAGAPRASHLVTFVDDDGTNVELTLRIKSLGRELAADRTSPLRVRCHLANEQLAKRLEDYPKFFLHPHLAEISFFNVDGLAARTLLRQHPPEVYADALGRNEVHVAVFGFTPLAEQVVLQVARTAHYASFESARITICTDDIVAHRHRLALLYPGLTKAARVAFVQTPLLPDEFESQDPFPVANATTYVVCLQDEPEGLSLALAIRRATLLGRGLNAPVMVAMQRSDGLARLLESELGTPEIPDGLYPFGMLDEIVSASNIVNERIDLLAHAIHENYLDTAKETGGGRKSQVPWSALPEPVRNDNRLQADHVDVKLRAVGCHEVDGDEPFAFLPGEVERLARMERNRFVAVRYTMGWRAGEARSDVARIDDSLREPTTSLAFDIRVVRDIPNILTKHIHRTVRREIVVGVTGHRLHRLNNHQSSFSTAVRKTLLHIRGLHPDAAFVVMSSLAEGADRLVAESAMEALNARLWVPLPLPYELYLEDFGAESALDRDASLNEFHELLGRAERYFELPALFGNQVELERRNDAGAAARARQYALAGAYVVQRAHELVAVWDGEAHEGEGGTAQIVHWRIHGVPEAYRFPNAFFPPVEPTEPFIVPPDATESFAPHRLSST